MNPERAALMEGVMRAARGMSGAVHSAYRGIKYAATASPLDILATAAPDFGSVIWHSEEYYHLYLLNRSKIDQMVALVNVDILMQVASQKLKQGVIPERVMNFLEGRFNLLVRGLEEVEKAGLASANIALNRARINATRRASRQGAFTVGDIAATLQTEFTKYSLSFGPALGDAEKALAIYLNTVAPGNHTAWTEIYEHLSQLRKAAGKIQRIKSRGGLASISKEEFESVSFFRGEANRLKGFLLETWFWQSNAWSRMEEVILRDARKMVHRQRFNIPPGYEPMVIKQPLFLGGQEIYDGVVLLARPLPGRPNHFECFIHTEFQMKAEADLSVVDQINRDLKRKSKALPQMILLSRSQQVFDIRPMPGPFDPLRIIVAPQIPEVKALPLGAPLHKNDLRKLPPEADVLILPTLLDAEQLDEIAFLMLRAIVENALHKP